MKPLRILSFRKNCTISNEARIYPFSIITNSRIGAYSYISYNCKINNTTIGRYCSIAQNAKMGLGKHPSNYISTNPVFYSSNNPLKISLNQKNEFQEHIPIIIGNDVWIGTNVTILDGVRIGDGAIIGANSVVTKDIAPFCIAGGVPAKVIKKRFIPPIIDKLLELRWWNYSLEYLVKKQTFDLFSKDLELQTLIELSQLLNND